MSTGDGASQPAGLNDEDRVRQAVNSQSWRATGLLSLRGLRLGRLPDLSSILEQLTSLDLGANRLTSLPGWLTSHGSRLERLILAGNRLGDIPDEVGSLGMLRELDVSNNRLTSIRAGISRNHQLRRLDVSGNRLRGIDALSGLPGLLVLDAAANRIEEVPRPPSPATLVSLDLSNNELQAVPDAFAHMRSLARLDLSANHLTSSSIGILADLPLEELYLDDNELEAMPDLPNVRRLSFLGNPCSRSGAEPDLERPDQPEGLQAAVPIPGEQAAAAVIGYVTGAPEPGVHYLDSPMYRLDAVLEVTQSADVQRVTDLYYKRFGHMQVTASFADGSSLGLHDVSRRTALEFAQEHHAPGVAASFGLAPVRSLDDAVAFMAQAQTRVGQARLQPLPASGATPSDFVQEPLTPAPRVLNVALTDVRHNTLPVSSALAPSTAYAVRIDIGPVLDDTVIVTPVPIREENLQPTPSGDGYAFEVIVSSADVSVDPALHQMWLPRVGRSEALHVAFQSGRISGPASLRVTLYQRNNVIQSARVDFTVGMTGAAGIHGQIDYALADDAAKAEHLPERQANILTNEGPDGTHKIVVNNGERAITADLSDACAAEALTAARERMTVITLGADGDKSQYSG